MALSLWGREAQLFLFKRCSAKFGSPQLHQSDGVGRRTRQVVPVEHGLPRRLPDPAVPLFLMSPEAGGLGLNLTAAEHVFLLDPWWNPAVEAQAMGRAHRIGQARHVFAFRLIARGTVEEILALQAQKRDLAEAIMTEHNSLIRTLTREDLELLLS